MNQSTDDLAQRVAELDERLQRLALAMDAAGIMTITAQVQTYLRQADLRRVRRGDVCARMQITPKILQDRLKAEGTRYKEILDNERYRRVAERLRIDPRATCHDLTDVAGYSDHQNLVRSFKRWFGIGLLEYRGSRGQN